MSDPVIIGNFGKTFGIYGWIKVNSFTIPKNHILGLKPWLMQKDDFWEEFCFADSKENIKNILVKLPNYNSPEVARRLTNIKIGIWRDQLPKLPTDEYYWSDLVGLKVLNLDGADLGIVQELMATGANDVLIIDGDRQRLIPYISTVITKVDLPKKIIHVDWEQDF